MFSNFSFAISFNHLSTNDQSANYQGFKFHPAAAGPNIQILAMKMTVSDQ